MDIRYIIVYSSIVVWLLPPFRQYRGNYFSFFLVLGLEGLSTILFSYLHISLLKVYNIMNIIVLFSLINFTSIKKYWYLFFLSLAIILLINHTSDNKLIVFTIILTHLIIFYIFLKDTAINYNKNGSLSIGYFIILLYEITAILKFCLALSNIRTGIIFFYLTTAFESFIAIFFTIYKLEESLSIKLALASKK